MQRLLKRWLILGLTALPLTALADAQTADAVSSAAAPAPVATFPVLEYQVEGNTVLSNLAIEEAVYPHLGEKESVADVEQARKALEKAYHDAGYLTVLVDIPEQEVKSGLVRLKVTEAKVDRLKVSGSRYYSLGWIRQHTPALAEGSVPYFPDVQKQLTELARTPDRQVVPVLRAGRAPGTVEVDLQVKDQLPLHGSLEVNNRYGANTTPDRLIGTLRYDNLWQRQHSLSFSYQVAPEKPQESNVLSATYVVPGVGGQAYALYAVRSRSNVSAVSGFTSLGMGNFYGMRWIMPLRSHDEHYNHTLSLGVDYKNSFESVLGGADSANAINTSITYMPYLLQYAGTLREGKALIGRAHV